MNNNSFKFITEDSNKIEPPVDFMKPSKLGDDIINNRVVIDKKRDVVIDDIPGGISLNNMSANNEFVDINNVPTTETNEFVNVAPVSIEEPVMNIQEIVEVAPQIEELDIKQVDDVSETVNINENVDVTPQGFAQVQVSVQSEAVPVVDVGPVGPLTLLVWQHIPRTEPLSFFNYSSSIIKSVSKLLFIFLKFIFTS